MNDSCWVNQYHLNYYNSEWAILLYYNSFHNLTKSVVWYSTEYDGYLYIGLNFYLCYKIKTNVCTLADNGYGQVGNSGAEQCKRLYKNIVDEKKLFAFLIY